MSFLRAGELPKKERIALGSGELPVIKSVQMQPIVEKPQAFARWLNIFTLIFKYFPQNIEV